MFTSCYSESETGGTGGFVAGSVVWAAYNVAEPGRFTTRPEEYGNYYDFTSAQSACPDGWRTPSRYELGALYNQKNEWAVVNGVKGRRFGSGSRTLFLPAAGYRYSEGTLSLPGDDGGYWSGTRDSRYEQDTAYRLHFNDAIITMGTNFYWYQFSVRCVKDRE